MTTESTLLQHLHCEKLDDNLYRGQSLDISTGQIYGGQVLGQAINAAEQTVIDEHRIHSAHAYFLRRGDVNAPVVYEVDRSRDGRSFTSRRVVAIQHGKPIFHLSASFQAEEPGLDFFDKVIPPIDVLERAINDAEVGKKRFKPNYLDTYLLSPEERTEANSLQMWVKTKQALPSGQDTHHPVVGYISDISLLPSAVVPHRPDARSFADVTDIRVTSLDHAIWFHRPFRADEWLFYDCRAESTGNGRGFSRGKFFTKDGTLVASTSQEGVVRKK